jgi:Ca2+/Na+ antiporter
LDILLLIIGLGLILAGANFLTDGSAALAQRFRVPEFIIGLTVVAVGTSTPELALRDTQTKATWQSATSWGRTSSTSSSSWASAP